MLWERRFSRRHRAGVTRPPDVGRTQGTFPERPTSVPLFGLSFVMARGRFTPAAGLFFMLTPGQRLVRITGICQFKWVVRMSDAQSAPAVSSVELLDETPSPANGDPYVAVLAQTNGKGVATEREAVTLGTGFTSGDQIAYRLHRMLESPSHYGLEIDFKPDKAELFCIAGTVTFE